MMPFPLFLAVKYLKPKRSFISVVTLISILGVLIGVAILMIVSSVMTGFDNMWKDRILSFKPHLTVVSRYGSIKDEERLCQQIDRIPGVTGVAATVETRTLIQYEGRMLAPIVVGVSPDRAGKVSKIPNSIVRGQFDLDGDKAVLGVDLAAQLRVGVGSRILVHSPMSVMSKDEVYLPEELTVTGIFNMGMWEYDSGFVLTSLDVARELMGMEGGAASLYVMTDDPYRFEEYAARLQREIGPEYEVRTWKEVDSLMFDALTTEKTMMFILLIFISIVAIFCVTNTLIVITVEKTNEIGLLKAIGVPSWKIMLAFMLHGLTQCVVGIAGGFGVGYLILRNLKTIVGWLLSIHIDVFPKQIYAFSEIPWQITPSELRLIAGVVLVFCMLASLLPAWRAARMDPVDALRNE